MRSVSDRIRHAISFEIIGLLLVTPLGALVFNVSMADMGVIGIGGATIATLWNYIYNVWFDHAMMRFKRTVHKTLMIRIVHAGLFEAGLLAILMPFIAWYLQIGLIEAFLMDVSFALFYLVYAFVFNLAYDKVFPLPANA